MSHNLRVGDMFRCVNCDLEIQVTSGCHKENGSAIFYCCGEPMADITEPPVQESPDKIDEELFKELYVQSHVDH